jgi:hypothetical protein
LNIQDALNIVTNLVTILGLPILIGTILLLIRQLRVQAYQATYESALSIDQFLVEHSDLRQYLYEGKALPENDPDELERISAAACMLLTFFEHVVGQKNSMSKAKWIGWKNYICDVYKTSPAVQYFLNKKEHWHSEELKELLFRGRGAAQRGLTQR